MIELIKTVRDEVQADYEDHIEETIAEFGDSPTECLSIIEEHIQLARHFRAHPNAPRVEWWVP